MITEEFSGVSIRSYVANSIFSITSSYPLLKFKNLFFYRAAGGSIFNFTRSTAPSGTEIENCGLDLAGGGQGWVQTLDSGSPVRDVIKNSYFFSSGASYLINFTVNNNSYLKIKYSEFRGNSLSVSALMVFNVAEGIIMNLTLQNCNFIVDNSTYIIDKTGNGTLNIFVSNCGALRTADNSIPALVNPNAEGTVNIYYMNM